MASKGVRKADSMPAIGWAGYLFLAYWLFVAIIYVITDFFIELYQDNDFSTAFWYSAILALPLAIGTLYCTRESLFTAWYTYLTYPVIIYGLYLASAYFTYLKLDLLVSATITHETGQVLPVRSVERVIARKQGFIYTDVNLNYENKPLTLVGTRTSYFLLKPYRELNVMLGHSYLGSYYVTDINIPSHARWTARKEYVKDWFQRRYFIFIVIALIVGFGMAKDKYFPSAKPALKKPPGLFAKFLKRLAYILLVLFGVFVLVLLLVGLFM